MQERIRRGDGYLNFTCGVDLVLDQLDAKVQILLHH